MHFGAGSDNRKKSKNDSPSHRVCTIKSFERYTSLGFSGFIQIGISLVLPMHTPHFCTAVH
eukprot:COSAG01_NODE_55237_length_326_cov_1.374449_1_plen_60_part_01